MKFGDLLTQYLKEKEIDIKDMARSLQVTTGYIYNLEHHHRRPPTLLRCIQMAQVLNLNELEKKTFLQAAYEGRLREDDKAFLLELSHHA